MNQVFMLQFMVIISSCSLNTASKYENIFYVTPNAHTSCPRQICYQLTKYLQNSSYYFQSSTQFIFMPGVHTFDAGSPLLVQDKEDITLIGSENFTQHTVAEKVKEYGFDPYGEDENITFMQSTTVIICTNASGFSFSNIRNLSLINMTILNCGLNSAGIYMSNISNLLMEGVSIQNSTGYGLLAVNVLGQSQITRSSFIANNQYVKDMLVKTNAGGMQCNGVTYDHTTAYLNNGSLDCNTLAGGNVLIRFDDSSFLLPNNWLSFSYLLFSLGTDGTYGASASCTSTYTGTGLSIAMEQTSFNVNTDIENSVFYRNQASMGANFILLYATSGNFTVTLTNNYIIRGVASDRGAGMEFFIVVNSNITATINATDLIFQCNFNFIITDIITGSALNIQLLSRCFSVSVDTSLISFLLQNCIFNSNFGTSSFGIGANTFQINKAFLENPSIEINNCLFLDVLQMNYSIYASSNYYYANPSISLYNTNITGANTLFQYFDVYIGDTTFTSSQLWALQNTITFEGNVIFSSYSTKDNGGVLYLTSVKVVVAANGQVTFINNTAMNGGAMFIDSQSYLVFTSPCNVSFINNTALLAGGALYVQREAQSAVGFPAACFFGIIDTAGIPIIDSFGVHLYFEGNYAGEVGSVLYGGSIDNCIGQYGIALNATLTGGTLFDTITIYGYNNNSFPLISSEPTSVCLCEGTCSSSTFMNVMRYPGQQVHLSFITVGQRNSIAPTVVILYSIFPTVQIIDVMYATKQCFDYSIQIDKFNKTLVLSTETALTEVSPSQYKIQIVATINLTCPDGFDINDSISACVCNGLLMSHSFVCNINDLTFVKPGGKWIGVYQDADLGVVDQCPFDYCSDATFINVSDFGSQCNYNRRNVLCGQCQHGLSMTFGSSQCRECSNYYLLLVVPFAFMGVLLVLFMIVFDFTVANGKVNGLILYAFVIRINSSIFFPPCGANSKILKFLFTFISWLNLDLGIETCLYDGMDSYSKTWLQFVFPVYLCIIIITIIVSGHFSATISRLCRYKIIPIISTILS